MRSVRLSLPIFGLLIVLPLPPLAIDGPGAPDRGLQGPELFEPLTFSRAFLDSVTTLDSPRFVDRGHIVFSDQRERRIHSVDLASGDAIRFGRPGSGPGEFQACGSVTPLTGGDVVVWDPRLMRVSRFRPDGGLVDTSHLEFAYPTPVEIAQLGDDRLVMLPNTTRVGGQYGDRVLMLDMAMELVSTFLSPCTGRVEALEEAYGIGRCDRVLAPGRDETLLIAESFSYTIRRYRLTGELIWDSGKLDETFVEPDSRISPRREDGSPVVFTNTRNGVSMIREIAGRGFVVGGFFTRRRTGTGTTTEPVGFIDFRGADGRLLLRRDLETGWMLGDAMVAGDHVYLLSHVPGVNELPDIALQRVPIRALDW